MKPKNVLAAGVGVLIACVSTGAFAQSFPVAMCRPTTSADVAKWAPSNAGYQSTANGAAMSCGFSGTADTAPSGGGNELFVFYKASAVGQS